jgi:hypothetical protein
VPPKFEQVFEDIKQELTTWEPQMSLGFLKELKLDGLGEGVPIVPDETPPPPPRNINGRTPPGGGDDATASNPHFLEATFGKYRRLTTVKTRAIVERLRIVFYRRFPFPRWISSPCA